MGMFHYHRTNGSRGEIIVERDGAFLGFVINLGRADQWASYDRNLKLLGEDYGSQAQAAMECWRDCITREKIPIHEILARRVEPQP